MISKFSHATIFVANQDEAKDFYVNKIGLDVRTDVTMEGGFRWLTVGPKDQLDMELILMEIKEGPLYDKETVKAMRELLKKGALGTGVFETPNCMAAYEEMKAKGVEFTSPPAEKFYGTEALFKDNSGNWFSMCQRKEH